MRNATESLGRPQSDQLSSQNSHKKGKNVKVVIEEPLYSESAKGSAFKKKKSGDSMRMPRGGSN